jgi:hypothetical protein
MTGEPAKAGAGSDGAETPAAVGVSGMWLGSPLTGSSCCPIDTRSGFSSGVSAAFPLPACGERDRVRGDVELGQVGMTD